MKKYVMLVNVGSCNQCYACSLSCKDEHFGNDHLPIACGIQELGEHWVRMHVEERGSHSKVRGVAWPEPCHHCEDPACVKADPATVYQREDGIVIIDPLKAKGNEKLLQACPYNTISWNSEKELPQKCTLCAHMLDAGEPVPRCVEACPNRTLLFGDANDPNSEVAQIIRETPELAAQTGVVRYYNIPGRFVAGSVYLSKADVAVGAEVTLKHNGEVVACCKTNGFGDFDLKNLPENMELTINITCNGFVPFEAQIDAAANDHCWEEIVLQSA